MQSENLVKRCKYCGFKDSGPYKCKCSDDIVTCDLCHEDSPIERTMLDVYDKTVCLECMRASVYDEVPDKWDWADRAYQEWKDNPEDRKKR